MSAVLAFLKLIPLWLYAVLVAVAIIAVQHFRIVEVSAQRDDYEQQSEVAQARIASMQNTARLQRELAAEASETINQYQQAKNDAEAKSSDLAAQLRAGSKRLQVNGQCVSSTGKSTTSPRRADAGTFRLSADAESAYLRLSAGIDLQRAQVIALQKYIRSLESRCKIGG